MSAPSRLVSLFVFLQASVSSDELLKFKVDASAEGCTGLFWREWSSSQNRFVMGSNQQDPPWPRNGAFVEGRLSVEVDGFLLLDGGRALPFHDAQKRYTYLHMITEERTGFLPYKNVALSEAFDVLIIGSGPAGLTAALYAGRNARTVLVVGGPTPGGAMMISKAVENFPSSENSSGADIMAKLVKQVSGFGVSFLAGSAKEIQQVTNARNEPHFETAVGDGQIVLSKSIIVATGATERWLGLPGEEILRGKFLHTCAYCDAHFYVGKDVCVIGGGDGALEAAAYLARVSKSVTIIHRRDAWRGSAAAARRIESSGSVKIVRPFVVEAWVVESGKLIGAKVKHASHENGFQQVNCAGAFINIGRDPQSQFMPRDVDRDARGFVLQVQHTMTSIPGIFAAGQLTDARYQQAVTAAASGAAAAMDVSRWLEDAFDAGANSFASERSMRGFVPSNIQQAIIPSLSLSSSLSLPSAMPSWSLLLALPCVLLLMRFCFRHKVADQCPKVS